MATNPDPKTRLEREEETPLQEQFIGLVRGVQEAPAAAILAARAAEGSPGIPAPVFIP
ncbi:MAG: hypothetical protein ABWK53_06340 [Anaerolineales bacterium]